MTMAGPMGSDDPCQHNAAWVVHPAVADGTTKVTGKPVPLGAEVGHTGATHNTSGTDDVGWTTGAAGKVRATLVFSRRFQNRFCLHRWSRRRLDTK